MVTLMIVEDEQVERRALRQLIEERLEDVKILPDCANGLEAIDSVAHYAPDILVVDIKMPGMNGIEVVKQLRKSGYAGKIMICTAYNLFDYARDALNYGANAFLLKPVKHADFLEAINRFAAERAAEAKSSSREPGLTEDVVPYLIPNFLTGNRDRSVAPEELRLRAWLKENISRAVFISLGIAREQRAALDCSGQLSSVIHPRMVHIVCNALPKYFRLLHMNDAERFLVFGYSKTPCSEDFLDMQARFTACRLLHPLEKRENLRMEIGISTAMDAPEEYAGAYERVVASRARHTPATLLGEAAAVRRVAVNEPAVERFLEEGDLKAEPGKAAAQLLRLHLSGDAAPIEEIFAAAAAVLMAMGRRAGGGLFEKQPPDAFSDQHIVKWFSELAESALKSYRKAMSGNPDFALKLACKYVQHNFSEDLSLVRVAGYAGLSAPYLSHLFSQKLGMGFVDYLQKVRLDELMRLLAGEADYSIRELCALLGYNSENYFCRVVKQKTGKTIKQLKKQLHRGTDA